MRPVPAAAVLPKLARIRAGAQPRVVDLFSGCGGMSLGFQLAGCQIVAGIEKEEIRARTHARNFHQADQGIHGRGRDITEEDPRACLRELCGGATPDIDLVVGGPPCQAYARVGRAKLREIAKHPEAYLHDDRGSLYAAWLSWVEALRPAAVVMENVPDILSYGGVNIGEMIAGSLDSLGYDARYTLLNAAHYGVPQTRERWFLIGVHRAAGAPPRFPSPTRRLELPVGYRGTRAHASRWNRMSAEDRPDHAWPLLELPTDVPAAVTCEEAIGDLPVITEAEKLGQKRGARDLTATRPYSSSPRNAYQRQMRRWPRFKSAGVVSAHVIRSLPRDYPIFRRMRPGDDYPAAHAVAVALFDEKLEAAREASKPLPEGRAAWARLRKETVPPYDPGKFPNKWRKLESDFPSRTLLAHLSHDSYSHIHYSDEQARTISVREAARLQSFPDGFEFCGAMNAAFGQIGNAVPPLLAAAVGSEILSTLGAGTAEVQVSSSVTADQGGLDAAAHPEAAPAV